MTRRGFLGRILAGVVAAVAVQRMPATPRPTMTPAMIAALTAPNPSLFNARVDVLYGFRTIRPDLACRVLA